MAAGQVLTAGRSENNDIAIEHPTVSRRHIELRVNGDESFDVIDLGSSAGTFVFHNGEWTRFGHATVASDEHLRLGNYETTAGALFAMAGEGGEREQGPSADEDSGPPTEDIHEVTTHRRGERRPSAPESNAEEEEQTTRRKSAGTSKKGPETKKLPVDHATSEVKRGPAARSAKPARKPQTQPVKAAPEIASPSEAPTDAPAPGAATSDTPPKALAIAYLLWFFLGGFGAHRFYLGSIGIGITHAALLVVGVVPVVAFGGSLYDNVVSTIFVLLGVAVLTCLVVWLAVDAFLIPGLVRDRRGAAGAKS